MTQALGCFREHPGLRTSPLDKYFVPWINGNGGSSRHLETGRFQDGIDLFDKEKGHLLRTSGITVGLGPERKCRRFRTAIRLKTSVQENKCLLSASATCSEVA